MAKKTTRGNRLNEAQLKAYRTRKAETVIQTRPEAPQTPEAAAAAAPSGAVTSWGNVAAEYRMIRADIRRLLLITVLMLAILIVLWFIYG